MPRPVKSKSVSAFFKPKGPLRPSRSRAPHQVFCSNALNIARAPKASKGFPVPKWAKPGQESPAAANLALFGEGVCQGADVDARIHPDAKFFESPKWPGIPLHGVAIRGIIGHISQVCRPTTGQSLAYFLPQSARTAGRVPPFRSFLSQHPLAPGVCACPGLWRLSKPSIGDCSRPRPSFHSAISVGLAELRTCTY